MGKPKTPVESETLDSVLAIERFEARSKAFTGNFL
jgi:hypothetical protein